ncbi:hypothetical protein KI387_010999, partial [Taxus chinensis]
ALLAFKSAIEYDQNNSFITWTPNVSFCNWNGVTCSLRRHRVVSLNLSTVGLEGTISPFIGNLSFLRILNLSANNLHGHIPSQLGSLSRLRELYLYINQLQGSIPPTLSACLSLRVINLLQNNLVGNIPPALGFLPNLQFIQFSRNNLTGNIPNTLGNISSLDTIDLRQNKLDGPVPWELGMLNQLRRLNLGFNLLTGEIPSSLSNCTNLQRLGMVDNYLSGEIPWELCSKNTLLTGLFLGGNRFSGRIPLTLFNCSQLEIMDLSQNQMSGIIPPELGKLHALTRLNLYENQFVSGSTTNLPILTALTNCPLLNHIDLSLNHLTGVMPSSVGQLPQTLEKLYFSFNKIGGEIPPQIGNLTNLTLLALDGNIFTGTIPSTITKLQRMERLYLSYNNLQGNIPIEIGQLKHIGILSFIGNKLSGNIPDSLAELQQIRELYLGDNLLTGSIPASLGDCLNLQYLDLSYNKLSGQIPPSVAGLPNLAFYFNLSNNLLEGSFPSEISKMEKVQPIDISANRLTGHIPDAIGSCAALEYLNLSYNEFNGPIPDSLRKIQYLQYLDFSSNNLSGRIPMSLDDIKALQHLNFSSNKLSGEVPQEGVFKKLDATSFIGNPDLCGPWVKLPPCSAPKHKSLRHLKRILIPIGAVVFVTCCALVGYFWRRYYKRPQMASNPFEVGPQKISYEELLMATDGFSEANLLGIGAFGKVFKGVLKDGTMVAVKVLNMQREDAYKSFDRECNVLRRVRHRNLLRIITIYSDPEFKVLIFPLVQNGSLYKVLYRTGEQSSQGQVRKLNLAQRLNIAMDIVRGMEYLHHHCFVQVIHCDLKPGNVLLGEDMTAYLIDFGISRLCLGNSLNSYTSTHALKGSIGYIAP